MRTLLTPLLLSIVTFSSLAQNIPKVKFNHLYFVINTDDLLAIRKSDFIKNKLTSIETRTTKANNGESWTGTYLYGSENYFEVFDSVGFQPKGTSGFGFSVDHIGELNMLKEHLDKNYKTSLFNRERDFDGKKIPWFDGLSIDDSAFNSKSLFGFWVMEYRRDYFDYQKYPYKENQLTRENYLKDRAADRKEKILKRFCGVVMKLNVDEKRFLIEYFNNIKYVRLNENEYLSPDNFSFLLKNRASNDNNTIESLAFETTKKVDKQTIKVSDNVSIFIDGDRGHFIFK